MSEFPIGYSIPDHTGTYVLSYFICDDILQDGFSIFGLVDPQKISDWLDNGRNLFWNADLFLSIKNLVVRASTGERASWRIYPRFWTMSFSLMQRIRLLSTDNPGRRVSPLLPSIANPSEARRRAEPRRSDTVRETLLQIIKILQDLEKSLNPNP